MAFLFHSQRDSMESHRDFFNVFRRRVSTTSTSTTSSVDSQSHAFINVVVKFTESSPFGILPNGTILCTLIPPPGFGESRIVLDCQFDPGTFLTPLILPSTHPRSDLEILFYDCGHRVVGRWRGTLGGLLKKKGRTLAINVPIVVPECVCEMTSPPTSGLDTSGLMTQDEAEDMLLEMSSSEDEDEGETIEIEIEGRTIASTFIPATPPPTTSLLPPPQSDPTLLSPVDTRADVQHFTSLLGRKSSGLAQRMNQTSRAARRARRQRRQNPSDVASSSSSAINVATDATRTLRRERFAFLKTQHIDDRSLRRSPTVAGIKSFERRDVHREFAIEIFVVSDLTDNESSSATDFDIDRESLVSTDVDIDSDSSGVWNDAKKRSKRRRRRRRRRKMELVSSDSDAARRSLEMAKRTKWRALNRLVKVFGKPWNLSSSPSEADMAEDEFEVPPDSYLFEEDGEIEFIDSSSSSSDEEEEEEEESSEDFDEEEGSLEPPRPMFDFVDHCLLSPNCVYTGNVKIIRDANQDLVFIPHCKSSLMDYQFIRYEGGFEDGFRMDSDATLRPLGSVVAAHRSSKSNLPSSSSSSSSSSPSHVIHVGFRYDRPFGLMKETDGTRTYLGQFVYRTSSSRRGPKKKRKRSSSLISFVGRYGLESVDRMENGLLQNGSNSKASSSSDEQPFDPRQQMKLEYFVRQGQGALFDSEEKSLYVGEFHNGVKHGRGILEFLSTGERYVGEWVKGVQHGRMAQSYKDGSFFSGQFTSGKKSGDGTVVLANGYLLRGSWSSKGNASISHASMMEDLHPATVLACLEAEVTRRMEEAQRNHGSGAEEIATLIWEGFFDEKQFLLDLTSLATAARNMEENEIPTELGTPFSNDFLVFLVERSRYVLHVIDVFCSFVESSYETSPMESEVGNEELLSAFERQFNSPSRASLSLIYRLCLGPNQRAVLQAGNQRQGHQTRTETGGGPRRTLVHLHSDIMSFVEAFTSHFYSVVESRDLAEFLPNVRLPGLVRRFKEALLNSILRRIDRLVSESYRKRFEEKDTNLKHKIRSVTLALRTMCDEKSKLYQRKTDEFADAHGLREILTEPNPEEEEEEEGEGEGGVARRLSFPEEVEEEVEEEGEAVQEKVEHLPEESIASFMLDPRESSWKGHDRLMYESLSSMLSFLNKCQHGCPTTEEVAADSLIELTNRFLGLAKDKFDGLFEHDARVCPFFGPMLEVVEETARFEISRDKLDLNDLLNVFRKLRVSLSAIFRKKSAEFSKETLTELLPEHFRDSILQVECVSSGCEFLQQLKFEKIDEKTLRFFRHGLVSISEGIIALFKQNFEQTTFRSHSMKATMQSIVAGLELLQGKYEEHAEELDGLIALVSSLHVGSRAMKLDKAQRVNDSLAAMVKVLRDEDQMLHDAIYFAFQTIRAGSMSIIVPFREQQGFVCTTLKSLSLMARYLITSNAYPDSNHLLAYFQSVFDHSIVRIKATSREDENNLHQQVLSVQKRLLNIAAIIDEMIRLLPLRLELHVFEFFFCVESYVMFDFDQFTRGMRQLETEVNDQIHWYLMDEEDRDHPSVETQSKIDRLNRVVDILRFNDPYHRMKISHLIETIEFLLRATLLTIELDEFRAVNSSVSFLREEFVTALSSVEDEIKVKRFESLEKAVSCARRTFTCGDLSFAIAFEKTVPCFRQFGVQATFLPSSEEASLVDFPYREALEVLNTLGEQACIANKMSVLREFEHLIMLEMSTHSGKNPHTLEEGDKLPIVLYLLLLSDLNHYAEYEYLLHYSSSFTQMLTRYRGFFTYIRDLDPLSKDEREMMGVWSEMYSPLEQLIVKKAQFFRSLGPNHRLDLTWLVHLLDRIHARVGHLDKETSMSVTGLSPEVEVYVRENLMDLVNPIVSSLGFLLRWDLEERRLEVVFKVKYSTCIYDRIRRTMTTDFKEYISQSRMM